MSFYYGQSQFNSANSELLRCWMAKDLTSADNVKRLIHALILLSSGLSEALEDFSERLPPVKS